MTLSNPVPGFNWTATGGYEATMALALHQQGIRVSIVNPSPVRNLAKVLSQIAKTDAIDARLIAKYGEVVQPMATVFVTAILIMQDANSIAR